jgi:hypothetical protein
MVSVYVPASPSAAAVMLVFWLDVLTMSPVIGPLHAYTLPVPPLEVPVSVMVLPTQTALVAVGVMLVGSLLTVTATLLLVDTAVLQVLAALRMLVIVTVVLPALASVPVTNVPVPEPITIVAVRPVEKLGADVL